MKKYYEILEVNPKASVEVIEKAYKVLAKKYHPDSYEGEEKIYAEQRLKDVNEAYKILSDIFLREQYDNELQKENEMNKSFNSDGSKTKKENKKKKIKKDVEEKEVKKNQIGTYKGIIEVTKSVFENMPHISLKNLKREDYIAMGLTVVVMIIILIAMWFIPFTNGFIRNMLPFLK